MQNPCHENPSGEEGRGGADGGGCFRSHWDVVVLCQLKGCVSSAHVDGAGLSGSLLYLPVVLLPWSGCLYHQEPPVDRLAEDQTPEGHS